MMYNFTTPEAITALHRVVGAPPWMCRMVLDACDGDRRMALRLVKQLRAELPEGLDEARGRAPVLRWLGRSDLPKNEAVRRARANAREEIASGDLTHVGMGYPSRSRRACVPCRVWYCAPFFSRGLLPERCPRCDGPLVRAVSTGCVVDDAKRLYVRTHNAIVDAHLRAKYGAEIRWSDFQDVEIDREP